MSIITTAYMRHRQCTGHAYYIQSSQKLIGLLQLKFKLANWHDPCSTAASSSSSQRCPTSDSYSVQTCTFSTVPSSVSQIKGTGPYTFDCKLQNEQTAVLAQYCPKTGSNSTPSILDLVYSGGHHLGATCQPKMVSLGPPTNTRTA